MRKTGFLAVILAVAIFLAALCPVLALAQDKVEAPNWMVGDKWVFTGGSSMEITEVGDSTYTVKYSTSRGRESISFFDKSSLNRVAVLENGKRMEYKGGSKRMFNFPFSIGQTWKDKFSSKSSRNSGPSDPENSYFETYKIVGWEEIVVKAGKFKALKIDYLQEGVGQGGFWQGKSWFWYSPEVKYLLKCVREKSRVWTGIDDWEVISYVVK